MSTHLRKRHTPTCRYFDHLKNLISLITTAEIIVCHIQILLESKPSLNYPILECFQMIFAQNMSILYNWKCLRISQNIYSTYFCRNILSQKGNDSFKVDQFKMVLQGDYPQSNKYKQAIRHSLSTCRNCVYKLCDRQTKNTIGLL